MKLTLSLKITLCLLLNVLLLGVAGAGFLLAWGGFGWDSLVAGPAGQRVQAVGDIVAGAVMAANTAEREAVLDRFATAYAAEFLVLGRGGQVLAGDETLLPPGVRRQLGVPLEARLDPRAAAWSGEEELDLLFPGLAEPPPFAPTAELAGPPRPAGAPRSRSLVRAGAPAAYWISLRVVPGRWPGGLDEELADSRPERVIVQVESLWGLIRLLELQPWLLGAAAALLLSAVVWLPLLRGMTQAIRGLTAATERIAEGRFDLPAPAQRHDELGRLGESVNRMATRIDTLLTGQKRFLGDVAHELCSPLARLQMATGILEERATPGLRPAVEDVREEVQQMAELVNDLLDFTKAGLGPRVTPLQACELAPLIAQAIAREAGEARIACDLSDGLRLWVAPELLRRAVGNLLRNAVRYAGAAGPIQIVARPCAEGVRLSVLDEGPGVPPEALHRLGEPFFRPEVARTREAGGVGLGLAIASSAVQQCGGTIRFANRTPRGFAVEILLPPAPPVAAG